MPTATLPDSQIWYRTLGDSGPFVVLTAGGRWPATAGESLAQALAEHCRVIVYDRRNSGVSSPYFGPRIEADVEADDVAGLAEVCGADRVHILGGGGGARCALLAATRYPDLVASAVVWWVTGGPFGIATMASKYTEGFISAVRRGGLEELVDLPELSSVMADPNNRQAVLSMDASEVLANLLGWFTTWTRQEEDGGLPGLRAQDLKAISAPVLVFDQSDDYHPAEVCDELAELIPGAARQEPPAGMGPGTFWARQAAVRRGESDDPLADWRHLEPPITEFLASVA
jgi:pimeloyl-ACP methyl ester carboxylesterase